MHIFASFFVLLGTIYVADTLLLQLLDRVRDWSQRRLIQLVILALPMVSLLVLTGAIVHVTVTRCILSAPLWDHMVDVLALVLMSCIWVGTLFFGGVRLVLMKRLMQRRESIVDPALQASVDSWASRRGLGSVRVRLTRSSHPIALLYGMRQPTVLLSTWMVHHLDAAEFEAVVAHELEHVSRRDYLINWWALLLRDAFFYLPTSKRAYRQFCQEKELACDDQVISTTQRPLALASALTKVWLHLAEQPQAPRAILAQALVGSGEQITHRVDRLLTTQPVERSREPSHFSLRVRLFFISLAAVVIVTSVALMLIEMGCCPGLPF